VCLEIDDKFEHSVLRHPESLSATRYKYARLDMENDDYHFGKPHLE
jgi:hypothetical protein